MYISCTDGKTGGKRGCFTAPSSDTLNAYRPILRILLKIKDFPGAKSAGNEFSLSVGKRTFAKILLVPAKPVLRIEYGGAAAPPYHPFKSRFPASRAAHHLKRRYCSTFVCNTAFEVSGSCDPERISSRSGMPCRAPPRSGTRCCPRRTRSPYRRSPQTRPQRWRRRRRECG